MEEHQGGGGGDPRKGGILPLHSSTWFKCPALELMIKQREFVELMPLLGVAYK